MKKLLLAAALVSSMLLCSCTITVSDLINRFIFEIKKELDVKDDDDNWYYTYQKAEPEQEKVKGYIIDFYISDYTSSHSKWACLFADGYVDCDLLYIKYF